MQLELKNKDIKQSYSYFKSTLHRASDHSAIILTVFAGRTVKISTSLRGPGFEPQRPQLKRHWSIDITFFEMFS